MRRKCDYCKREYDADMRNIKRGWGLCCSKSCAASKREKSRPDYDPLVVAQNNYRRNHWNDRFDTIGNYDPGDSEYWDSKDF